MRKKSIKWGFTMVELLVVMTIIAVLAGLSLVSFDGIRKSARDGKRKADLESMRSALEVYRTDCRSYPETADLVIGTTLTLVGPASPCTDVVYLDTIPTDSSTGLQYYYKNLTGNRYVLCAHLETTDADTNADCGSNCTSVPANPVACNYAVYSP